MSTSYHPQTDGLSERLIVLLNRFYVVIVVVNKISGVHILVNVILQLIVVIKWV